ncbi:hypothetical protein [Streptomyces sp. NPDC002599]|uniref:hypothetical protein n=1 Tax=Streptomyces sp. NPDC002599 TaxID=3154421 RepID=UPI003318773A
MKLLTALAGGVGGEAGRQAWAGLSALVRRPSQHDQDTAGGSAVSSGEAELFRLEQAAADLARAQALSTALAVRAAVDADFQAGLQRWHQQAKLVHSSASEVHNEISGGTFHGPVAMGRDFTRINLAGHTSPGPENDPDDDWPQES